MTAPLDLDADRLESIRARAVQGYAPTMRDTLALLAEVERLRAVADFARLLGPARMVLDRCAVALIGTEEGMEAERMAQQIVDLIGHPVTDEPPHALVELERLRAESVPRSSLVQVRGWRWCEAKDTPESWEDGNGCLWCFESDGHQPVYVIREDSDA